MFPENDAIDGRFVNFYVFFSSDVYSNDLNQL